MSAPLRILVWQWGRRGAGPRFAMELAAALAALPSTTALLCLSLQAELMQGPDAPDCALPYSTYSGVAGFVWRLATLPLRVPALARILRRLRPDVAICAMPGPLDLLMAASLRRIGVPFLVMVHDADPHPGDGLPGQMTLQRLLMRQARGLVVLSTHVADRLRQRGEVGERPMIVASHPPFVFGPALPPPRSHGGRLRLLFFGRLLPYKGLDLLADALRQLGPRDDIEVRIAGQGPDSAALTILRGLPNVTVENRWIAETEIAGLLAWSDALVLSYREASQSGVAALAMAARRWVVATRVGGIAEQLQGEALARLCAPDAASLAAAISGLITDPPAGDDGPDHDPKAGWHDIAATLVEHLRLVLRR